MKGFAVGLTFLLVAGLQSTTAPRDPGASAQDHVQQLIASLPPSSMWRKMMEHGARGDGIRQPWMDEMRDQGLKLADLTFEFDWLHGGKELRNWRLVWAKYFTSYDSLSTQPAEPVTDPERLKAIRGSGLEARLEAVGLARAKRGIWVEDPAHQHPPRETGTGFQQVFLAEDEWLPVQMFPWFAAYASGTTPLMHAALLGDVARIKKLLAEGADVNGRSPDGSTALIYAATSENQAALAYLLKSGADTHAEIKGGGNALTAAVVTDHAKNVELLLKAGMDPNVKTAEGEGVLSFAIRQHLADIVLLLKRAGARE